MSDLWDRCRAELRKRMSGADWDAGVQPLGAWFYHGVLYLWPDRERCRASGRRVSTSAMDEQIRAAVRSVWGREPARIVRLPHAPNRELIINDHREAEHREGRQRRERLCDEVLMEYAKEEIKKIEDGRARVPPLTGSRGEQLCQLQAIVINRAKRRLESEGPPSSFRRTFARGEPPQNPPPWRPDD